MINSPSKTERIHALDSLRAIMMMLGLVIHTSITYGTYNYSPTWPAKDPNHTSLSMDWLVLFIHMYRMPIFFIVAGFFGALLFYKKGVWIMLQNRMSRILYPFIVFLLILTPFVSFSFYYADLAFKGTENAFYSALAIFSDPYSYLPTKTYHLWFLYYLFIITFLSFGIGIILKKVPLLSRNITAAFDPIIRYPFLKLLVFSGLTFILLYFVMDRYWVATKFSMIPDFNTIIFYSYFYLFGWVLYKSKQPLGQLTQYDWVFTVLAITLFTIKFFYSSMMSKEVVIALNALMVWLFTFGITGLFIRYGSNHSTMMRYVSDSSYWFYLFHLPISLILPGMMMSWSAPGPIKFLVVLLITTLLCWVTYHYLVRSTFIGKFLNGRKYPRSVSLNKPADKLNKAA